MPKEDLSEECKGVKNMKINVTYWWNEGKKLHNHIAFDVEKAIEKSDSFML